MCSPEFEFLSFGRFLLSDLQGPFVLLVSLLAIPFTLCIKVAPANRVGLFLYHIMPASISITTISSTHSFEALALKVPPLLLLTVTPEPA